MLPARKSTPFIVASALIAVLCVALHLAALAAANGAALYRDAVNADDRVSYSATITSVVYEGENASSTVARVEHKAPHSWRIWYLAPADAYGRMIVSNEQQTYQYEPSRNRVISHDWNQMAPGVAAPVDVAEVEKNYGVEVGPTSSVAGRKAITLSLVSKHTGSLAQRIWVDDQTKLILRRENYDADGGVDAKSSFDSLHISRSFPQGLFDLSVPKGMTLEPGTAYGTSTTDTASLLRALNFKFAAPKYLPEGFALKTGSISLHDDVQTVQLVYGDGLRTFSLFENATARLPRFDRITPKPIDIGNATGLSADVAGQTLVSWNADRLNFTIVGDLSTKEIAKIGASIHP